MPASGSPRNARARTRLPSKEGSAGSVLAQAGPGPPASASWVCEMGPSHQQWARAGSQAMEVGVTPSWVCGPGGQLPPPLILAVARAPGGPAPAQEGLAFVGRAGSPQTLPSCLLGARPHPGHTHNYLILLWQGIIESCVSITDVGRLGHRGPHGTFRALTKLPQSTRPAIIHSEGVINEPGAACHIPPGPDNG